MEDDYLKKKDVRDKKSCVVVIPVYQTLTANDKVAVQQAIDMTAGMDKVFVMPESFVPDESFAGFTGLATERFADHFFVSTQGYNRLMLDSHFYRRFSDYQYVLIHQTDAFLFKPDLQHWCDKEYDYVGAPWLTPRKLKKNKLYAFVLAVCPWIYSSHKRRLVKHYNNVGNGGLSLRKIETFIKILESAEASRILKTYFERMGTDTLYNEDVFWSFEGPRLHRRFRKPHWSEAIRFAVEFQPSYAYRLMNNQLPFGCHAALVHEPEFWQDHVPFVSPEKMPQDNS